MSEAYQDCHVKGGIKFWSVTTVLSVIDKPSLNHMRGFMGNEEFERMMFDTAESGKHLHSVAKNIIDSNGFHIPDNDNELYNDLEIKFGRRATENVKKIKHFEKRLFSEKHHYCGRIDGVYLLEGKKDFDICDIKTGSKRNILEAWQLAAYKNLCIENGIRVKDRVVIECKRDNSECRAIKINSDYKNDLNNFLFAKHLYLQIRLNKY
jgi:hypothetical protein